MLNTITSRLAKVYDDCLLNELWVGLKVFTNSASKEESGNGKWYKKK